MPPELNAHLGYEIPLHQGQPVRHACMVPREQRQGSTRLLRHGVRRPDRGHLPKRSHQFPRALALRTLADARCA